MKSDVFYELSKREKFSYKDFMIEMADDFLIEWYIQLSDETKGAPCIDELVTMVCSEVRNAAVDCVIGLKLDRNINDLSLSEVVDFMEMKEKNDVDRLLSDTGFTDLFDEDEVVNLVLSRIAFYNFFLYDKLTNSLINEPRWWDVW